MKLRPFLVFAALVALGLAAAATAQTVVRGPHGGAVARGRNGAAVRAPNGAVAAVGPRGRAAAVGPNGAAVRTGYGTVAAARPAYGAATSRAFYYGGHRYHGVYAHPFVYPPGWAYRQWAVGAVLPALFLTSAYYYTGYAAMGLPPPMAGHQWIRYAPICC
jgi:Ni/Co efflux regulator RcnB